MHPILRSVAQCGLFQTQQSLQILSCLKRIFRTLTICNLRYLHQLFIHALSLKYSYILNSPLPGVNPSSLYGKDTFVYACSSNSEAESCTTCTIHSIRSYLWLMTHAHCYLANRISNLLNLHGKYVAMNGFENIRFPTDVLTIIKL